MNPTLLWVLRAAKSQLRYTYMFIPIGVYLILLIFYPFLQYEVMGRELVDCSLKTPLIELDEQIFQFFYLHIGKSFNQVLLTICAFPYLVHFGSPAFYLLYLLIKRPGWYYFWLYGLSLGFTSSISIILQYTFPTAPPWIYAGLPPEAKFYIVDQILPIKIFHGIYGLNKIVCGAFPSIHVEWPTIVALNGVVSPYFGVIYVIWITTAAIYSQHHWISDVLTGMTIAFLSTWLAKLYLKRVTFAIANTEQQVVIVSMPSAAHLHEQANI